MCEVITKRFDVFILEAPDALAVHWGWPIALGLTIAILRLAGVWKANTASILYVRFLGALALLGAMAVFAFSFTLAGLWTEFFVHRLWVGVLFVVGLIMLSD